jgi:hypothetical protein
MGTAAGSSGTARASGYEALNAATEALDSVVGEPADDPLDWAGSLEDAVRTVIAAYERHRDLAEAPGGTLEHITASKPHLMRRIDRQRDEHTEYVLKATRFADEIAEQRAFERISVERFRLEAGILRDAMRLHLLLAEDLLYQADYVMEGGESGG